MDAIGIIFANIHDNLVPELTAKRTLASVPFGARYRIIDFPLSSMVNSGIFKVGVAAKSNYQSLMDHLAGGKDWDLARRTGGLFLLPPYSYNETSNVNASRLEALSSALNFITRSDEEYVLLSDGDCVYNADFTAMLRHHIDSGNDVTLAYKQLHFDSALALHKSCLDIDAKGKVTGLSVQPMEEGLFDANLNIYLLKRELLIKLINYAVARGQTDFQHDIIGKNIKKLNIGAYRYEGEFFFNDCLRRYFDNNMRLLDESVRKSLFNVPYRPIYTKVKDSAPTKFFEEARVSNCFIADGCEISGKVINSVLFRDVVIEQGATVSNCLVMQNTVIAKNSDMSFVLTDKNVRIGQAATLKGCANMPYVISKGAKI